jgi:mannose-6-phosphate isomerase class I
MCVSGCLEIEYNNTIYNLIKGETILIPACIKHLKLTAVSADILEVSL